MWKRVLYSSYLIASFCLTETKSETETQVQLAKSMAKQLSFGLKRSSYYLETLIEQCNNINDFAEWFGFLESYFKCDTKAGPTSLLAKNSPQRLDEVCASWLVRRKCSKTLASRMNSCLNPQIESGEAGSNALRMTDAHMKFICNHKQEYSRVLDDNMEIPIEKRHMSCHKLIEEPLESCLDQMSSVIQNDSPFCQKFRITKSCMSQVSMERCGNSEAKRFMQKMLKYIDRSLQFSSNGSGMDAA